MTSPVSPKAGSLAGTPKAPSPSGESSRASPSKSPARFDRSSAAVLKSSSACLQKKRIFWKRRRSEASESRVRMARSYSSTIV
jgi:hypothetical protein